MTTGTIAFRASATASGTSGATVTVPASVVANDFMLLVCVTNNGGAAVAPAGWTLVRQDNFVGTNGGYLFVYRRLAQAGDAGTGVACNFGAGNLGTALIVAYSGVDPVNPVNAQGSTVSAANGTAATAPSVTTTTAGCMIVELWAGIASTGTVMNFTGPATQRAYVATANYVGSQATDQSQVSPGATGAQASTLTTTGAWAGTTIALSPGPLQPGALLVAPYQYEISDGNGNSLLMGANTDFWMETISGLFSLPDISDRDVDRQLVPGAVAGIDVLKKRKITMQMIVRGLAGGQPSSVSTVQTNLENNLALLMRFFQPSTADLWFSFRRPAPGGGTIDKVVFVRPKKRDADYNWDTTRGAAKAAVQIDAANPRIYSLAQTALNLVIPNGGTTVSAATTPAGEYPSLPVITINGPATNPRIANAQDSNKSIKIDVTIPTGQALVIDLLTKTVKLNGADAYQYVRTDNQWWQLLQKIANNLTYSRSDTSASSTATVVYRDTWM